MSEIDDRRQRAREAAWDEIGDAHTMRHHDDAIESGVIVATQVKITDEHVRLMYAAGNGMPSETVAEVLAKGRVRAASLLAALGFEVIE